MKSSILILLLVMTLDTGQTKDDCRDISDGCNCPIPGHLRCKSGHKEDLEKILSQAQNITLLDISLTNLGTLDPGVFKPNISLSALVISSSQLENISPRSLEPLKMELTALSLPNNLLKTIPSEVFTLPSLTRLDLSQNNIDTIDEYLPMEELEFLNLGENKISDINHVQVPNSLKKLVLEGNYLTMSSIARFKLNHLRELDLSFNQINGTLAHFQASNSLRSLDMSFNALSSLSNRCLSSLTKLRNLDLKSNKIEVIQNLAFQGLTKLKSLDLSSNGILELPSIVFDNLDSLEHLDLSNNHLQVISGTLTSGLVKLDTLKLGHNDIIKIDPLKDVQDSLSTLLLDSNPLDCSCLMRPFQSWLQKSRLSLSSKKSVRCSTPTKFANAILTSLEQLSCGQDEDFDQDIIPLQLSIPEEFRLLSKSLHEDDLELKWVVELDNFTNEQVQLFKNDNNEQVKVQFYSAPLMQLHMENSTILEANFHLKKLGILTNNLHPVDSILACATIMKNDLTPVTNCTEIKLKEELNKHPKTVLNSIQANLLSSSSIKVDYSTLNKVDQNCQINLQVEAGDADDLGERVVANQIISCTSKEFIFEGLRFVPRDKIRICAWLDFGPLFYHTNSVCSNVIRIQNHERHEIQTAPILPLVLTLVFLAVGIACLLVLYLIVKGYLSDRHKAELFRMRFCSLNNNNANNSEQSNRNHPGFFMRWTHWFFMWKIRRNRHHAPVPDSDELSLREESTFDTSVV